MNEENPTPQSSKQLDDTFREIKERVQVFLDYMELPRWKRILYKRKFFHKRKF